MRVQNTPCVSGFFVGDDGQVNARGRQFFKRFNSPRVGNAARAAALVVVPGKRRCNLLKISALRTADSATPELLATARTSNSRVPWPIHNATCSWRARANSNCSKVSLTESQISGAVSINGPSRSNTMRSNAWVVISGRISAGRRCSSLVLKSTSSYLTEQHKSHFATP